MAVLDSEGGCWSHRSHAIENPRLEREIVCLDVSSVYVIGGGRLRDWRSFARGRESERDEITRAHWGKPGFFLPFSLGMGGRSVEGGIVGGRTMDPW